MSRIQSKYLKERLGEENINYQGCKMKILEYVNAGHVLVEFQDKHKAKKKCAYGAFKAGQVKNSYFPSVLNIGYIGENVEPQRRDRIYIGWVDMLDRCYGKSNNIDNNSYRNLVTVCEEWLCFQNFADWVKKQNNYENIKNLKWQLDKDILIKGNKVYAPNTCVLVPNHIKALFIKGKGKRGNYPIGISFARPNGYQVHCSDGLKQIYLGYFTNIQTAFETYKKFKEKTIKSMAEKAYENQEITTSCYKPMMDYQVKITD